MSIKTDVVIIGSGMSGATVAAGLAPSGKRIVILERGGHLPATAHNRSDASIFVHGHFRPKEEWLDGDGQAFNPGNYYYVGGNTKFYGAVLIRYRREDFSPLHHLEGSTPGWPISYDTLEPFYSQAEQLFQVRGDAQGDPTEPEHSQPYPHAPVPDEPDIADLRRRLQGQGLHPSMLPLGVDIDAWLAKGQTPWDAFPDTHGAKMDAESISLAAALRHPNVTLRSNSMVTRLVAGPDKRITQVLLASGEVIEADQVVLAAGAVQTAALLLASRDAQNPRGLANRSDQVGRNFMNHNCSAVLALHPLRRNRAIYQKTLMVNDFYLTGGPQDTPLGNIQMLGKISPNILAASSPLPRGLARWIATRSLDLYAMSEDLPNPESRVSLVNGQIKLDWKRSNWKAHLLLVDRLKAILRRAGYPVVVSRAFDRRTPSHQCGTAKMGLNPDESVVDINCRSHDHPNLYITDASVLPTSAAVNPSLTIAALSLRAAQHLARHS